VAAVETRKLTKVFAGGEGAVNEVDLAVRDGELLVLLGPSGSGKSTLLRMIAGLEEPTGGDVLIGGEVVTHLPPQARGIAMVFQSYALYPHLTVAGNIAFPLEAQRVPKALRRERVERAAALLGLGELLGRRPRELSGGERQRVALARALVREPAVLLLDEPLSNLDAKLRASAREELARFHARVGTTTLHVTHDQVEAMAMGDRIVVLDQGRVRQVGTPRELYDAPADTFVATFLGSPPMNLLDDGEGILGFRPERLLPAAAAPAGGDGLALRVRVTLVEYLGPERIVHGVVEGGPFDGRKVVSRLPLVVAAEPGPGAAHAFAVARSALLRFDRATGRAVWGYGAGGRLP
jgi:multiple sugar transport system ATP-binding protein